VQLHSTVKRPPLSLFEDKDGKLIDSELPFDPVPNQFVAQMQNFLRSIRGEEAAINSSVQAVHLMEMLDAIYHSSLTGREVSLG